MTTPTRPVNLTSEADLRAKAEEYIAWAGLPNLNLVRDAIANSNAHGDPFCDNPYRRVLIQVAIEHGAVDQ